MKQTVKKLSILGLILAFAVLCAGNYLNREQRQLSEKLIRLHVVANSDSESDQALKLEVRDAVLEKVAKIIDLAEAQGEDPKEAIADSLPELYAAAQSRLEQLGSQQTVGIRLGNELFPTREYETFSLPAGIYTALRINLGKAEGHNWWCVVFPNLCMTASMDDLEQAATVAGLTSDQVSLITEDSDGYVLKFKSIEILQSIKNWIQK